MKEFNVDVYEEGPGMFLMTNYGVIRVTNAFVPEPEGFRKVEDGSVKVDINESMGTIVAPWRVDGLDDSLVEENLSLKYVVVDNTGFIDGYISNIPYHPFHVTDGNSVYRVCYLLQIEEDGIIGVEKKNEGVKVVNVETSLSTVMEKSKFENLLNNGSLTPVLKVGENTS